MIGAPKIEERGKQSYMGIRTQVTMRQFSKIIPQLLDEIFAYLAQQGVAPAGPPFMRYHVINMTAKMDVELGVPVDVALPGNGRVKAETLPAGRYASLIYQDIKRGVDANGALLRWGADQGLQWDRWQTPEGDAFGGRIECYLTDPEHEPDSSKWETEVAIRLVDC